MNDLPAFSVEQAASLAGLAVRQVVYWADTGVFVPQYVDPNPRRPYSRMYSFRDLVGLRALAKLRKRVPLQELRKISVWLKERYESPWSSLRFYVIGRDVIFDDPETGEHVAASRPRQQVLPIELAPIARETQEAVSRLRQRAPADIGRVDQHRYVVRNTPVLKGTRIPTVAVWNFHAAGYSTDAIIRQYPRLTAEDVRAAIEYESERQRQRAS